MNRILVTFFLIFFAVSCKQESQPKDNASDRDTVLREYIQEFGKAECAKKEMDEAWKSCNSDKDCVFNQINANCYVPDPTDPE